MNENSIICLDVMACSQCSSCSFYELWKSGPDDLSRTPHMCNAKTYKSNAYKLRNGKPQSDSCQAYYQSRSSSGSGGGCYIATAVYGSYNCPQVWLLRRYRDNGLAKCILGRLFIRAYYAVAPTLIKWFGKNKFFNNLCRKVLNYKVQQLRKLGIEDTPYLDR